MGAYVSISDCEARYHVVLDCEPPTVFENGSVYVGGFTVGQFQPDPDVAGIGVLTAFIFVTGIAAVLSILSLFWWSLKYIFMTKTLLTTEEKSAKRWQFSFSSFLETIVITCSDQQVFTGAAYAITLRYAKGCQISAYHYNLVASMMLLTCATHLMAVTIARNYWKHKYLAVLRILVTTGVFLATGLLLSNQNVDPSWAFPTEVPPAVPRQITSNSTATALNMFLPAACFQSDSSHLINALNVSFSASGSEQAFLNSTVNDKIHGWNMYLIMLLVYMLSTVFAIGSFFRSGIHRGGLRARIDQVIRRWFAPLFRATWLMRIVFATYVAGGIGVACWTIVSASFYMFALRSWADHSQWMQTSGGINPENDPTSFGQLVPMCLVVLTLFAILQTLSEQMKERKHAKLSNAAHDEKTSGSESNGHSATETGLLGTNGWTNNSPADKKSTFFVSETEVPPGSTPLTPAPWAPWALATTTITEIPDEPGSSPLPRQNSSPLPSSPPAKTHSQPHAHRHSRTSSNATATTASLASPRRSQTFPSAMTPSQSPPMGLGLQSTGQAMWAYQTGIQPTGQSMVAYPTGFQPTYVQSPGIQPTGVQPTVSQPVGQPMGAYPAGIRPTGIQPVGQPMEACPAGIPPIDSQPVGQPMWAYAAGFQPQQTGFEPNQSMQPMTNEQPQTSPEPNQFMQQMVSAPQQVQSSSADPAHPTQASPTPGSPPHT